MDLHTSRNVALLASFFHNIHLINLVTRHPYCHSPISRPPDLAEKLVLMSRIIGLAGVQVRK